MYFLSFLAVLSFKLCYCQFSPNCELELFTTTELENNQFFRTAAENLLSDGNPNPPVVVSDFRVVCVAQGTTEGLYRAVSVVVNFTVDTTTARRQYDTWCYNDEWFTTDNTDSPSDDYDPPTRYDCRHCRDSGGEEPHNCIPCAATCADTGLGRCTNFIGDECCGAFLNNTCTSSCPTNYTTSADFICVCDICDDPGFAPNGDCNDCIVTDICLADNPCMNNGTCILNTAPDDYTCDCAPGFTGPTCDTEVVSSTSMTPTPTPTSVPCSVGRDNCAECDPTNPACCRSCDAGYELDSISACTCVQLTRCNIPNCISSCPDNCCSECEDGYERDGCNCNSIEPSRTTTPTSSNIIDVTDRNVGLSGGALAGIIVSIILGILVLLVLTTLIIYLIYYFVVGAGAAAKAAKGHSPFANGESHDNPLYLRPEEVTSDATLL